MSTSGFGGREIRKVVQIKTDDPQNSQLQVVVTGKVEKFAEIRPERLYLRGETGKPISAEIELIPRKEYPFTVKSVKVVNSESIKTELTEPCTVKNSNRCVIKVAIPALEKGTSSSKLLIQTTSKERPEISISVVTSGK